MALYLDYTTRDGDRWDLIAYRMYGDPWKFEGIIAANPDVPIRPVLPGGLTLRIPVVRATVETSAAPPWRQT